MMTEALGAPPVRGKGSAQPGSVIEPADSVRPEHADTRRTGPETVMTSFHLPENPDLGHLRGQARELLKRLRAAEADAVELVAAHHPRGAVAAPRLADAQLTVARAYGFTSWPDLRRHLGVVEQYTRSPHRVGNVASPADELLRLACLRYGGDDRSDQARAATLLAEQPELGRASIHAAAATGDLVAARAFLAAEPSAATRLGGPFGWEPLLYLAYSRIGAGDALATARLLLDHGADPDAGYLWEGTYPFTALTGAFGGGEDRGNQPRHPRAAELARQLLEAGADPNDSQSLYNRQFEPDDTHLRLLIEFGLGTDRDGPWQTRLQSHQGTPAQLLEDQLSVAATEDRPIWARLALAAGADPDGRGTRHPVRGGASPLELAVSRGNREVARLLLDAGATPSPLDDVDEFLSACLAGDRVTADRLLAERPAVVADARERGPNAVLRAAEVGRAAAVRVLVGYGFDVHAGHGTTPLHQAAYDGNVEVVTTLLELGADPGRRDASFDATPLNWAQHNHQDTTAALLGG